MLNVVTMPISELTALVELGTAETGLPEAIIEKDLWVCYILDYLFHRSSFANSMIFKGGTSLSKAYGLIERFSEDVDLILDWRRLGYGYDEPWQARSNTKQERFKADTIARTESWLSSHFVPALKTGLSAELGIEANVRMANDSETVLFAYPHTYSSPSTLEVIKLEVGPLAAWTPSESAAITPYLAELHPQLFEMPSTTIPTALPERTFWEKATILHQEANRPESKALPRRYARHYYDMYRLGHSDVLSRALLHAELLEKVVAFKEKFYRTPWARLSEAKLGTLKLAPQANRLTELDSDYRSMRSMIFGSAPRFDEVVSYMHELETIINSA
ncbi:MAG: nucleotidyl transferase AbiEii/AbiGii toxin family protein [Coriobacteriales bacterium]|nr:nucleotidyl transferase AbiEii/AbiGii toxin family protein [Coriobacteriales bacterium]